MLFSSGFAEKNLAARCAEQRAFKGRKYQYQSTWIFGVQGRILELSVHPESAGSPPAIVTRRDEILTALANAEDALASAVAKAPAVDASRTEPDAEVLKARAQCRQLRATLVELSRLESVADSSERADTRFTRREGASERSATAHPTSRAASGYAVRRETRKTRGESAKGWLLRRFDFGFLAQGMGPRDALVRPPLLRQSMSLFSLTSAYLAYYYIDVQLQILSLPTNFL